MHNYGTTEPSILTRSQASILTVLLSASSGPDWTILSLAQNRWRGGKTTHDLGIIKLELFWKINIKTELTPLTLMCCVFFSWLGPRKVNKSEWLNIKRIIQFKMKVLYLFFHFVSFIVFSSRERERESCTMYILLQEAAPRLPPLSSLAPLPQCRPGPRPRPPLLLPQAGPRGASEAPPGQSDQPDGSPGPEHQSVQWTFNLPLASLSRHAFPPSPDQNVSTDWAGDTRSSLALLE